MVRSITDKNILFGIFALQTGFITRPALVQAMTTWLRDKNKPLSRILQEQEAVGGEVFALLEALVEKHLALHGQDVSKSLAALSGLAQDVLAELGRISDAEVQQSLAKAGTEVTIDQVPHTTVTVGASTSRGLRFRILRPHAKGGLGLVYVARDEELNREVALKEIQSQHADLAESRTRFMLEAEITGGLEHPGIVPVYGLGQYGDGRPFYAMRFIRGDNLKDAIVKFHADARPWRDKTLELRELLERFIDVCNAIQYAHDRGILHRDLKPGNIMLGKYGETLVVDWGLAKPLGAPDPKSPSLSEEPKLQLSSASGSAATVQGAAVGTPQYMSPEQAAGRLNELGPASDIYSLGATLYALLTGMGPFEGPGNAGEKLDVAAVLTRVQQGNIKPPRQCNSEVSPPLEAICLKAMALKPEDRYGAPRALIDDIKHWLADEPVSAWPESWTVKARRWISRHRTLVTGMSAAVLVGMISLLAATVLLADRNAVIARQNQDLRDANLKIDAESKGKEIQRQIAVANHRKAEERLDQSVETLKLFAIDARVFCQDALVPGESKEKLFDVLLNQLEVQAAAGVEKEFNEDKLRARIFLYETVALTQLELGRLPPSAATLHKALALVDQWLAARPDDPGALGRRAAVIHLLGDVNHRQDKTKVSAQHFQEAYAVRKKLLGNDKVERFTPAKTITDLADSLDALERWDEAILLRRQAHDVIVKRIADLRLPPDHAYPYLDALNWTYQKAAQKTDGYEKKKEYLDQANATSMELFKLRKTGRVALERWAKTLRLQGEAEHRQSLREAQAGNPAKAQAHLVAAQKLYTQGADIAHRLATSKDLMEHRLRLTRAWYELARIEKEVGAAKLAEQHWSQCLHLGDELSRDYRNQDIQVAAERLLALAQLGRHAEAVERTDTLRIKYASKYLLYTFARIYAVSSMAATADKALQQEYRTQALLCLEAAIQSGLDAWDSLRTEPDLAAIRQDPHFLKLLEKEKKK